MKELSENILDISMNSVRAGASLITVLVTEEGAMLSIRITDDGCGMSPEMVKSVADPFCTTRKTRPVGLGIPFFKMQAEQTGGSFSIESEIGIGTTVEAVFDQSNIDSIPLGDMPETIMTLVGSCEQSDVLFRHRTGKGNSISVDTREIRNVLGDGVPLSSPEVLLWIKESLAEQYAENP